MRQLKNKLMATATCPDGTYQGTVSGYQATWTTEISPGLTQTFEYKMDHGYRGLNIKATVVVTNGEIKVNVR